MVTSLNLTTAQLNRKYRIEFFNIVGGALVDLPNLTINGGEQVQFEYNIGLQCFNTATFQFYQLNPDTVANFAGVGSKRGFRFLTWYQPNEGIDNSASAEVIFQGLVFNTNTYRVGTELVTEVVACDAVFNLNYPRPSFTFPSGTSGTAVASYLQNFYNGTINIIGGELLTKVYTAPFSVTNKSVQTILTELCADNACQFSQYSDGIYITSNIYNNIEVNTGLLKVITPTSGMVGNIRAEGISPQLLPVDYFSQKSLNKNNPFITVSVLLRRFSPTETVMIKNTEFYEYNNKSYKVYGIKYSGDYRNGDWLTTLKLYPKGA